MTTAEHVNYAIRTLPDLGKELRNLLSTLTNDSLNIEFKQEAELIGKKITDKLNLSHMVEGLTGELGELVSCTGTELKLKIDITNLEEELGDKYWYLSSYCHLRNIPVPDASSLKIDANNDQCFELLICAESTLTDLVKRFVAYNKEIDRAKELNTIYDIYVALFLFESAYSLDGNKIREKNIHKLKVRYPDKYSDNLAVNRDTDAERKVLES